MTKDRDPCPRCAGHGERQVHVQSQLSVERCPRCDGKGYVEWIICPRCEGDPIDADGNICHQCEGAVRIDL